MKTIDINTLNLSKEEEDKFFEEEIAGINIDEDSIQRLADFLNRKLKPYNLEIVNYKDRNWNYWNYLIGLKETVV